MNLRVLYNSDVLGLSEELLALGRENSVSYGMEDPAAEVRAQSIGFLAVEDPHLAIDTRLRGMRCKVRVAGSTVPMVVEGGLGNQQIYAALSALALVTALRLNVVESLRSLENHVVLPGRMSLIPGIKKSLLVDDSYDSDPESALIAAQEVAKIEVEDGKKKIAILGEMRGLGKIAEAAHCMLGAELAKLGYGLVVVVGEQARDVLRCAEEAGLDASQTVYFSDLEEAGRFVQDEMHLGDVVFIKGSKQDRLERAVKELMAFPLQAKEDLLVR